MSRDQSSTYHPTCATRYSDGDAFTTLSSRIDSCKYSFFLEPFQIGINLR